MNQREIDVLSILFSSEDAMTASSITDYKRELTQSTVTAVLRKLLAAEYVEVTGVTHSGKVLSRTYRPTQKAREALIENLMELYGKISHIVSAEEICKELKTRYRVRKG